MYLRHLALKNFKLMRRLGVPFVRDDGSPRLWTVFVGENGTCKTTLLRAVAIAAAGPAFANNLVNTPSAFVDRRSADPMEPAEVNAEFGFSASHHHGREYPGLDTPMEAPPTLLTRAAIYPSEIEHTSQYEQPTVPLTGPEPLAAARRSGLPLWFAAGYGTGRVFEGADGVRRGEVPSRDRLRSLFDQQHVPPGLDFVDRLTTEHGPALASRYGTCLRDALVDRMRLPRVTSIRVRSTTLSTEARKAEKVFASRIERDSAMMYYVKSGDIWSVPRKAPGQPKGKARIVKKAGIEMDYSTYLYFIDSDGDIARKQRQVFAGVAARSLELQCGAQPVELPADWLSQGYQAVLSLVADIIGNVWLEAGEEVALDDMEGIVLIDELDLHLHPKWQTEIVTGLKRTFPNMQFIATTHSPLVLAGCTADEVWKLSQDPITGDVTAAPGTVSPMLLTASELFREYFGIERTYASELGEALRQYIDLASNPYRSDAQDAEAIALRRHLLANRVDVDYQPVQRKSAS